MDTEVEKNEGCETPEQNETEHRRHWKILVTLLVLVAAAVAAFFAVQAYVVHTFLVDRLTIEVGEEVPEATAFLSDRQDWIAISYGTDVGTIDCDQIGTYPVTLKVFLRNREAELIVEDTIPPSGTAVTLTVNQNTVLTPEDLVTDIEDATAVTCSFETEPDLTRQGRQQVTVNLTDEAGNRTSLETTLAVIVDREAPVIDGVGPLTGFLDEPISYKSMITVTDNYDQDVQLEVDTSHVNVNEPGRYSVIYTATDWAGNVTTAVTTITISEKPENFVEESVVLSMAQEVLDEITTDDMTVKEVARAIFDWTYNNIGFTETSEKDSWTNGAYQGFTLRYGDCFIYFSTAKALLTQAGIPNIDVERSDTSRAHHYWSLVNCGDGWYHFDTCRISNGSQTFMFTDDEVAAFAASYGYHDYYTFDHSLYPATPTEPFSMD